jgi:predicted DCC family thiol-disulfide oxidoreductase YuxK
VVVRDYRATSGNAVNPPKQRGTGRDLLLFDGVCGLCNRLVRFVLARDGAHRFDFASLQSETGRQWLSRFNHDPNALDTVVVIADYRGVPSVRARSDAAIHVAGALGQPWRLLTLLRWLPRWTRDGGYRLVARSRYRIFGRYDTCPLPSPETRQRFIDL